MLKSKQITKQNNQPNIATLVHIESFKDHLTKIANFKIYKTNNTTPKY